MADANDSAVSVGRKRDLTTPSLAELACERHDEAQAVASRIFRTQDHERHVPVAAFNSAI